MSVDALLRDTQIQAAAQNGGQKRRTAPRQGPGRWEWIKIASTRLKDRRFWSVVAKAANSTPSL